MARYDERFRGDEMHLRPEWGRPHPSDPNWRDGGYHGMRMQYGPRQGAYGWYRQTHAYDLGGAGGVDGIYDEGRGGFDDEGIYHHPHFGGGRGRGYDRSYDGGYRSRADAYDGGYRRPRYDGGYRGRGYDAPLRHVEDGGVRGDQRHLRQYNRNSSALRYGSEYDRGFGHAPGARGEGQYVPDAARRRVNPHGFSGYNRGGGWAPSQGLDSRK